MEAALTISVESDGLYISVDAPPWGFRMVHLDGNSRGANPVDGLTATWTLDDGTLLNESVEVSFVEGGRAFVEVIPPAGSTQVTVTDAHGNTGTVSL